MGVRPNQYNKRGVAPCWNFTWISGRINISTKKSSASPCYYFKWITGRINTNDGVKRHPMRVRRNYQHWERTTNAAHCFKIYMAKPANHSPQKTTQTRIMRARIAHETRSNTLELKVNPLNYQLNDVTRTRLAKLAAYRLRLLRGAGELRWLELQIKNTGRWEAFIK